MTTKTAGLQQQPPAKEGEVRRLRRRWKKALLCCTILTISAVVVVVLLLWRSSSRPEQIIVRGGVEEHNFLKGNNSKKAKTTPTTSTSSSIAKDLAKVFDQVLIKANNNGNKKKKSKSNQEEIHVGKLLEACQRLADVNRDLGFSHSANDLMGNIQKVKGLYDRFPFSAADDDSNSSKESIRVLIEYEIKEGIHKDPTKQFDEHSASMGLLWLGRNINYQYDLFINLFDDDKEPYEAAKLAYIEDLKPHLNWTLQQIGQAALLALKPMKKSTILSKIANSPSNGNNMDVDDDIDDLQMMMNLEESNTIQDLKQILSKWKPLIEKYKQTFKDLNLNHKI